MTCLSAKICKYAKDCDIHMCSNTIEKCRAFNRKPNNNEEWLRQANKEEMEHTLTMLIMKDRFFADKEFAYVNIRFGVHCWLKEIHNDKQ